MVYLVPTREIKTPWPGSRLSLILQFQQVLHALLAVIRPDLPLDLQHTRITADETLPVLGYASAHRLDKGHVQIIHDLAEEYRH